ncbi:protein kinase domain-containing protein [Humibacter ginsenosidimutans]|uniref:non-specific serine/threonine protein kinase n=1 Tax=Humibacter ginsenosidimutans TaxID=2599293 RepID=A0A5B8M327_9MICO|nr:protein kinase [Humibacter ginsenosidimutans]QDZ14132.1 protein kinase [Humibacter ginsenosidimutans]
MPGYGFERLLGSGGFSDVFLYEQKLPRRKVAVKVLLTDELDQQSRAHFVSEANVMAQLSAHPYIVTIYHADVSGDDRPYFVMEYCSGPSLAERYKRERFEAEDALRIGVRVASAVATAHAAGILHRDIKPANVLTNDFGWPALTDFGISSTLEDELPMHTTTLSSLPRRSEQDTTTKQSVGLSVPWSPPEMFDDDPRPDVRSDVFSLAATVYTLLAGHTPFEIPGRSNGTLDLIGRIERGAITPLDRPDVPRTLVAVLAKGMATKREDRFTSAVEFARALQRVELELGYAPTGIEVPNLAVAAPRTEPATAADSADETRMRPVATVVAQPLPPRPVQPAAPSQPSRGMQPPPPVPGTVSSAPNADATRLREVHTVQAQAQASAAPVTPAGTGVPDHTVLRPAPSRQTAGAQVEPEQELVETAEGSAPRRRTGLIVGIGVACLVLVGGGVAAATLLAPHAGSTTQTEAPGGNDGQIDVSTVPDPVKGTVVKSADQTSVTFTWKNPKPKKGDTYQWLQEGTTHGPTQTITPTATVTGLQPGSNVCIDIDIVRGGRTSPDSLKMCSS